MKIGFIGLGNVGGKLAGSLIRNGFAVTVYDLSADAAKPLLEKGAQWGETAEGGDGEFRCGYHLFAVAGG